MTGFASLPPFDPAHVVGTGAAVGAVCRHYLSSRVNAQSYPLGTLAVNVLGSFALGLLTFAGVGGDLGLLLGTGLCGSFTTYSSFSFETVHLWESGEPGRAVGVAVANFLLAALAVGAALGVARLAGAA